MARRVNAEKIVHRSASTWPKLEAPEKELLHRYIGMTQIERGDFNGRVITIRNEDVRALGRVFGRDEASMRQRFEELGLRA